MGTVVLYRIMFKLLSFCEETAGGDHPFEEVRSRGFCWGFISIYNVRLPSCGKENELHLQFHMVWKMYSGV